MRNTDWRNSFWLRVAFAQTLVSLLLATLLFIGLYAGSSHFARHQLREEIATESMALAAEALGQGRSAIEQDIQLRLVHGGWYAMRDSQGGLLAGDARITPVPAGWHEQAMPFDGRSERERAEHGLLILSTMLTDGSHLFVGRDTHSIHELHELFSRLFGWTLLATLLLATLGGLLLGRIVQRRTQALRETTQAVGAGDLTRRVQRGTRRDEFDNIEANLNDMLDRVGHLMGRLREVSLDIAHDLRTPMSRLRQRLEAARATCADAEPMAITLDAAIADLDAQLATFAALLRIARIEDGSARGHFQRESLSALTQRIAEIYVPVADDSRRTIAIRIDAEVDVLGDRDLLTQLLVNLVENAIQHTPQSSHILVALSRADDGSPTLRIEDNGEGIPVEQRERVLLPRVRLDSSRGKGGSGLGLALVKAVADLHGAVLRLEDAQPGLRVSVRFVPA
ncbi:MAG: HAMP domain-containing sensor histidine kinase [Tahibacter sp.]